MTQNGFIFNYICKSRGLYDDTDKDDMYKKNIIQHNFQSSNGLLQCLECKMMYFFADIEDGKWYEYSSHSLYNQVNTF